VMAKTAGNAPHITFEQLWTNGEIVLNKLLRDLRSGVSRKEYSQFYT
jgi:hypothetical protein